MVPFGFTSTGHFQYVSLGSVKSTLHILYIQAIRSEVLMSLRLWNVFLQYLVNSCFPLLGVSQ